MATDGDSGIKDAIHQVDTRLVAIDGRFNVLDQKFHYLNNKINGMIATVVLVGTLLAFYVTSIAR